MKNIISNYADVPLLERSGYTQAILDNVIDGIIAIDEMGGIISFNRAAEGIFGYSADEVIGRNVKILMPEPYHSEHDGYLQSYLSTGVARIIGKGREVEGMRKNGECFPMELSVSEIKYAERRLFAGIVRDITERKRIEKMENEFVSTVSHELRTPLTSIAGSLGLLVGGALGEMPAPAKQMLDIAYTNCLRLTHLINDLLDMEKITAGKMHFDMQAQPLLPLLTHALETNAPYGEHRGVRLMLAEGAQDIKVRVDEQRLMQVLANFLSNAIKFSPQNSNVTVSAMRSDGRVRVDVKDQGPGIPLEFRSRIFQKFSQADSSDTRQKGGTGLGLAISKELVERMGGKIGFESDIGHGTTFYFELPVLDAGQAESSRIEETAQARILVVEDDPDVAKLLALMLQRGGYQSDIAASGEEALSRLENRTYAAMTLDLMLPGICGLEVLRRMRLRPETANLPVVVISAKAEDGRLAISGDFHNIDWLPKPIDNRQLLAAVEKGLQRKQDHRPAVLHVEENADLYRVVKAILGEQFSVQHAPTIAMAENMLAAQPFDTVLLDIELPDGSGWDLLPSIHNLQPSPRVIILSSYELSLAEAAKVEAVLLKSRISSQELLSVLNRKITKAV